MIWTDLPKDRRVELLNLLETRTGLDYIFNTVNIEIGSRSLMEPYESVSIKSIIGELLPTADFADTDFAVQAVLPTHKPQTIRFVPPESVLKDWEKDYLLMQEKLIYGKSLRFNELIARITELNIRFNSNFY